MNAYGCGAQDNFRQKPDNIRQKRSFLASTWVGFSLAGLRQRVPPSSEDPLFSAGSAIGPYVKSRSNLASPRTFGQVSFAQQLQTLQARLARSACFPPVFLR